MQIDIIAGFPQYFNILMICLTGPFDGSLRNLSSYNIYTTGLCILKAFELVPPELCLEHFEI